MDIKSRVTQCVMISGKSAVQKHTSNVYLLQVIKINKSSVLGITNVTPQKYPHYGEIKTSACLLLTASSSAHVIYRTTQNGPGSSKTWYLKAFHVQCTSLAKQCFGAVYNEFIQGSSSFELDQTAINPTL